MRPGAEEEEMRMKRIREFLSLVLSAALLAGLLAVPASAADKPYIRQVEAGKWSSWAVTRWPSAARCSASRATDMALCITR